MLEVVTVEQLSAGASDPSDDLKHERIASILAREIRSGRVGHGTQLPGELELAKRFSVSRNTVRSALAVLTRTV